MSDFETNFDYFKECSFQWLERKLISELYPFIKEGITNFKKTRHEYGKRPSYNADYLDKTKISDYKEKIQKIVKVLYSSDHKREDFLRKFPKWKKQRQQSIENLQKIANSIKDVRKASNVVKIAAGSVGVVGGAAIVASLLFPPAAPALLPTWLGGAALASAVPSIFAGAAPAVSSLAVAGSVGAAGGAVGNVVATISELVLTADSLEEVKKVIEEDKRLLKQLGVFEFLDDLKNAINDLFGKSTSDKILDDFFAFLDGVPPVLCDIQAIISGLQKCLIFILPSLATFLRIGESLGAVILSIFFVVFLVRRRGCTILNCRHFLGFVSAVDASVEVTRLIAAAGLKGTKLGQLIPRKLAGKIAVGAVAGVGIALDVATIAISSIDLAEGSLSEEALMINKVANELEIHLKSHQDAYNELSKLVARKLKPEDIRSWTGVIVNHIPLDANSEEIMSEIKIYLTDDAWNCILLEKLRTNGNHWLVEVPTSHAKTLLRQNYIIVKGEKCLVMK